MPLQTIENQRSTIIQSLLGQKLVAWKPIHKGNTPAHCGIAALENGETAFVKIATNAPTAAWLHTEHHLYTHLPPGVPRPTLLGWCAQPMPALALTDLSAAHWPPPWSEARIHAVLHTLKTLSTTPVHGLPPISAALATGWHTVASDPGSFLRLGLVTPSWLTAHISALQCAAQLAEIQGTHTLHLDVRSDNLCIVDGTACLVDWNHACQGAAPVDAAFWAPSLRAEGGPPPEDLLGHAPGLAAVVSGFYAHRAGLSDIPHAPSVRPLQQTLLHAALPWVIRALQLPPADGPMAGRLIP